MLNILVYNRSSKSLSQTVWNAALCLPKTSSWTGRGWPMPHSLCVLWRTISHFSTACMYRAGKRWASRALSAKWRDYLKVSRLNIYYIYYWSTTIEHSTVSWISSLANHFITNMFIFHQQMLSHLKSRVIPNSSHTSKGVLVLWMDHCLMLSCLALTWHAIAAIKAGYPPTSLLHVDSIYLLSGWEGSAADGRVFDEARRTDFVIPPGSYYLGDAGFPNCDSLLVPYRGVRYHLKEWEQAKLRFVNAEVKVLLNSEFAYCESIGL